MNSCCNSTTNAKAPTRARRSRELASWLIPSALLALTPKCPACVAAYVALWTGLGLSLATATYIRWMMLLIAIAALLYLAAVRLRRLGGRSSGSTELAEVR